MLFAFLLILSCYSRAFAQTRELEIDIPMRDGVKLHTIIFFPGKVSNHSTDDNVKWPTVVDRSPYGYGDMEWITDVFLPFGYVAVGQDMRGTEKSEGNFSLWMTDANDSQDLGDWIVSQEWSNGVIYTFGASADGIASLQTPRNNPKWLAAQYITWAPASMYDILFPHGTYKQETTEQWLLDLYMPNPDIVYGNIQEVHENEAHTPWWTQIELTEDVYKNIGFPSAFWAGWYDLFAVGTLSAFEIYNEKSQEAVRWTSKITIDPLGHCLSGAQYFTQNAVDGRTALVISQLLDLFGVHQEARPKIENITFYVMSSEDDAGHKVGQYWTSLKTWPKPRFVDYFMHAGGALTKSFASSSEAENSTYTYDPANPVPTMGGSNLPPDIGGTIECGPLDQAEIDKRSDVLVFNTEVLTDELPITGAIFATLFVGSDAVDTDFMVRLSDVYPTGEARIIQDNGFRMRWRNSGTVCVMPVEMAAGKIYEIELSLANTSYIVAPGHALRVAVTSSNYPRFSVNPNNGLLLADPAYPGDNVTAHNVLYHSTRHRSRITLPIVNRFELPEVRILKEVQTAYPHLTLDEVRRLTKSVDKMVRRMKK